jgi:hypothetical protein
MGGRCPDCLLSFASETDAPEFPALEILSVLGEGGMGVVYRARQTRLGRIVAVKVLSTRFLADPQFIQRFEREAEAMARLQHPHIVAIHDFGVHGGVPFLVLEHVEGKSLRTQLARGPLPPDRALEIASSLCEALAYAQSRSVIHRDLKPENILIDASGCAKLADFGLARLLTEKASRITSPDARVGTPHYMAPEQVEGGKPGDARADLYALGVVLYEMLTGQLPIGRFAPPSAAGLDPRLDRVVLRLLEKSPDARYESAARVKDDIERIRRSKPAIGRKALWGIGAGVVAAAALVLALGSREDPPVDPPPAPVPWTDLGGSATDGGLSRTPGPSFRPSVAVDRGGRPVVAWRDDTSGNAEIYLRRWDGAAWVEVGGSATAGGISGDSALSAEPALALDGQDRPVVAWFEESSGQYAIRLRRWTGTRWEDLGEGLSAGSVRSVNPTLALDAVGNPVVCWHGFPPGAGAAARREVYLRRWSGAAWTDLGGSGSGGGVSRTAGES